MKKNKLISVLSLLVLLAAAAQAFPKVFPSPALNGPTGVVRIPSADIIPYKNFNLGADFGRALASSGSEESAISYKMNLGAFHGLELGVVGGTERNSSQLREGVFVNMKLSLAAGDEPYPLRLALGVDNLFSRNQTDVYMVATKYFQQGVKGSFGFMADFPESRFRPLGMAGVEVPLGETLIVAGDAFLGETVVQVNAGAKLYLSPIFSFSVSGLNLLNGTNVKDARSAFVGFSWANPF